MDRLLPRQNNQALRRGQRIGDSYQLRVGFDSRPPLQRLKEGRFMFAEKFDECLECGCEWESQEAYDLQRCSWCRAKKEIGDSFAKDLEKIMADQRDHIMQYFKYEHLPDHLQSVSKPFGEMAQSIESNIPRNPERSVALRKLLEAKDAAVRAVASN